METKECRLYTQLASFVKLFLTSIWYQARMEQALRTALSATVAALLRNALGGSTLLAFPAGIP